MVHSDSDAPAQRTPDPEGPRPGLVVAVLSSAGICVALVQSMIFPLVPSLPGLLDTSALNVSWVISSTLLAAAIVTPISGRLGDMFGKRRLLLVSLGLIIAGSLVCAVSSALVPMVVGRTLQGLAMGTIPLGISIMRDELPPERVPGGIAFMSATVGIGGGIGMPLSAFVLAVTSWHVLFLLIAVAAATCLITVARVVPPSRFTSPGRFDVPGTVGLTLTLLAFLLVVTKGNDWGWTSPLVLSLAAFAAVVAAVWALFELRTPNPLVDLRVSVRPTVLWTNAYALLIGFVMYTQGLAFPQMMNAPTGTGYGLGVSMVVAGLTMSVGGVTMMLLAPVASRLILLRGPRATLVVGGVVMTLGYLVPLLWHDTLWQFMAAGVLMSSGLAFGFAAMPILVMGAVPLTESAAAMGINALSRSVGLAMSGTVTSVVLASSTITAGGAAYPTLDSFRWAYGVTLVVGVLAVACALRIPERRALARSTGP